MRGFRRVREQEGGNVRFWFEDGKGSIISFVGPGGSSPNAEIRISSVTPRGGYAHATVQVSASLYTKLTARRVLEVAERAIDRRDRTW